MLFLHWLIIFLAYIILLKNLVHQTSPILIDKE